MSQIQVRDKEGNGISLINIRLSLGHGDSDSAYDDKFTDLQGNTAWPVVLPSNDGYTLHVNKRNVDIDYGEATVHVDRVDAQDIPIVLEEVIHPVQFISIDDQSKFKDEEGKEWKMCFGSNYLLPQLVAEGIDIKPLLYDGLNGYRMFGTSFYPATQAGFKPFHPNEYPNWINAIGDTFTILRDNGKYGQLDLFCDNNVFGMNASYLNQILVEIDDLLGNFKGIFGSLGNEVEKNGINPDNFDRPKNSLNNKVIWACGSGLTGGPAPLSRSQAWNSQRQHLRRDDKMFIDIPPIDAPTYWLNHNLLFDETIGFADFNQTGSRTNNADWAYKVGRIMSAFNGGVIHLHSGGHSQPLGATEEFCKDEFVRAFRS